MRLDASRGICLQAFRPHMGIGDYVSRIRARPELESTGLHDKTRSAKGCLSRERKASVVLSYELAYSLASVTQTAFEIVWKSLKSFTDVIKLIDIRRSSSPDNHVADRHPRGSARINCSRFSKRGADHELEMHPDAFCAAQRSRCLSEHIVGLRTVCA